MADKGAVFRRQARETLKELRGPELRVARDFLEFLRLREEGDPTLEILANRKMMEDIREARSDIRKGRSSRFVPWVKVRRDV